MRRIARGPAYRKIAPVFWIGHTGRRIRREGGPCALLVAFFAIKAPDSNAIGLYHLPATVIARELDMELPDVLRILELLVGIGFADYDEDTDFVWVREMARFQIGERLSPRNGWIVAAMKLLGAVPCRRLAECFHAR